MRKTTLIAIHTELLKQNERSPELLGGCLSGLLPIGSAQREGDDYLEVGMKWISCPKHGIGQDELNVEKVGYIVEISENQPVNLHINSKCHNL